MESGQRDQPMCLPGPSFLINTPHNTMGNIFGQQRANFLHCCRPCNVYSWWLNRLFCSQLKGEPLGITVRDFLGQVVWSVKSHPQCQQVTPSYGGPDKGGGEGRLLSVGKQEACWLPLLVTGPSPLFLQLWLWHSLTDARFPM